MSDIIDYDFKLVEFKINGYVIFEDLIVEEMIDCICDVFMLLFEYVRECEFEIYFIVCGDVCMGLG